MGDRTMSAPTTVLFDAPGPKGRRNNVILSIVSALAILGIIAYIVYRFGAAGQLTGAKWSPFTYSVIQAALLKGLWSTIKAAVIATLLALVIGVVFALLRLSGRAWIRVPATALLEFFRGVPVLLLIFALYLMFSTTPFVAVVGGLALYNGMVLAEIIRAGIVAVPRGQREAAMSIGLRDSQTMRLVLMPQAFRAMMPTIVAQVVVLLKDSALGYIVTYQDLLYQVNQIGRNYQNLLPTFIVGAVLFIILNMLIAGLASWLERRLQRKTAAKTESAKGTAVR
ncbi:amino acid ABC transporter permease [Brevibacterium sp. 91QC2O2]|uniref:amino acid ABC transporter permease n=2 Tax=Brevibacterium TaxID=1696 RepID=UPI00211CB825|nr:amino acid ABC transporter permease [Brevibacterium sp. 91QC2O2]MCQ9384107.1 amino acid ABC transporter permease [Brevibacterium sp. 68QC2CO]